MLMKKKTGQGLSVLTSMFPVELPGIDPLRKPGDLRECWI
jgi:hypothetical protein